MTFRIPDECYVPPQGAGAPIASVKPFTPKGKHIRVVFKEGRDLNIFGVTDENLQGATLRYTDHAGALYVIYPEQVNYMQIKVID